MEAACALCEILKLSDAANAKCYARCLGSSTFAKKEEEELVLRRFQRISRKSFRSSSSRARQKAAPAGKFSQAPSLFLSLATFHLLAAPEPEPFKNTAEL
jgi:hypothetical protein